MLTIGLCVHDCVYAHRQAHAQKTLNTRISAVKIKIYAIILLYTICTPAQTE